MDDLLFEIHTIKRFKTGKYTYFIFYLDATNQETIDAYFKSGYVVIRIMNYGDEVIQRLTDTCYPTLTNGMPYALFYKIGLIRGFSNASETLSLSYIKPQPEENDVYNLDDGTSSYFKQLDAFSESHKTSSLIKQVYVHKQE